MRALLFLLLLIEPVSAVILGWNSSPGATDYKLHYGTNSHQYLWVIDAGTNTSASVSNLWPGVTYFFAVTASNGAGESGFSDELVWTEPAPILIQLNLQSTQDFLEWTNRKSFSFVTDNANTNEFYRVQVEIFKP